MKKKNGFTLVELLAVIVVLAIIMIIAIPSVLDTMNNARRHSFQLYIEKVIKDTQTQYVSDSNGGAISGAGVYVYDIKTDLNYTSTGNYTGWVTVDARNVDDPEYHITMYDKNYMINGVNITKDGMPDEDSDLIEDRDNSIVSSNMNNAVAACHTSLQVDDIDCYNRQGYKLSVQE